MLYGATYSVLHLFLHRERLGETRLTSPRVFVSLKGSFPLAMHVCEEPEQQQKRPENTPKRNSGSDDHRYSDNHRGLLLSFQNYLVCSSRSDLLFLVLLQYWQNRERLSMLRTLSA